MAQDFKSSKADIEAVSAVEILAPAGDIPSVRIQYILIHESISALRRHHADPLCEREWTALDAVARQVVCPK